MRDMIRLGQIEPVRKRISEATQELLGDTIVLTNADWAEASGVPGWSRAHVAHHISASADAMTEVTLAALDGVQRPLYLSEERRVADLERGGHLSDMDLQIQLDSTAGALNEAFAQVTDWTFPIRLPIGEFPLSSLVVARLHEVVLHHVDMRTGFTADRLDPVVASWLLQWACLWLRTKAGTPSVILETEAGGHEELGHAIDGAPVVSGSSAALWGWITGRTAGLSVQGADWQWPLLG